ncbi:MAG: hypothetical protein RIR00_766 [Pseudomonadota bacterium]
MSTPRRIRLWDLPTRLFHWLLVLAIGGAWASGELGGDLLVWHGRLGLLIIALVVFRLVWGVVGSTYARFGQFVRGPAAILAYLRGQWHGIGHNPLGALSVLGLLGLVSLQAATGLFAMNDDIGFHGPFYDLVSGHTSELLTRLHHRIFKLLLLLVVLHLAAISFYKLVRKDNLILPMLSGHKEVTDPTLRPAEGGGLPALLLALALALGAVYAASGVWLPPPPPPPPASSTPNW